MSGIILSLRQKTIIRRRFENTNSLLDFTDLLNYIERVFLVEDENVKKFKLDYLLNLCKTKSIRYNLHKIRKKDGSERELTIPDKELIRIQRILNFLLQIIFEPYSHHNSNGFLLGKDLKRNALPHVNKRYVLNMDLKNFFSSINFRRVKVVLELQPFNLIGDKEQISFLIANLCFYNNYLPQGAPTSPILSHIVSQKLDRRLSNFCLGKNIKYTRYADDLTFSSNKYKFDSQIKEYISKIIINERFTINENKTRVQTLMDRQEVTGLIVNQKVNIKKEYLQKVRAMLNNWEKRGYIYAASVFKMHNPEKINYNFEKVLLGHISYIKLIKGNTKMVEKLQIKYNFLQNQINYTHIVHKGVMNRLNKDNIKMERIIFENNTKEDSFISFCTSAFHQIENLINYYYFIKYPNFDDLLSELIVNVKDFKKRHKNVDKAKEHIKKIRELNISILISLFENDFFHKINII